MDTVCQCTLLQMPCRNQLLFMKQTAVNFSFPVKWMQHTVSLEINIKAASYTEFWVLKSSLPLLNFSCTGCS